MLDLITPHQDAAFGAQSVAYTGTAGSTTGWNPGPRGVAVWCTTDAYVKVGEGVTATTANFPVPANTVVLLAVPDGSKATWRVSGIQISSGGTLYAKPIA